MTAVDYYSLTAEQKANLSQDDVKAYARICAMEAGCISVPIEEPEFLPEEDVRLDTNVFFRINGDDLDNSMGIVFPTRIAAEQFIELNPIAVKSTYLGGGWRRSQEYTRSLTGLSVETVHLPTEQEFNRARVGLEESASNAIHNQELREKLDKRQRDYDRVTSDLWTDYRESKGRLGLLVEIRACFEEYKTLAKDLRSAITFMKKTTYEAKDLEEALGDYWDVVIGGAVTT